MKVLALVLLIVAAASARSAGKTTAVARTAAELGEHPYFLHLRLAVTTSGLLETCAASLIDARWALTAANCVEFARFVWVRYGVVDVFRPSFVSETSTVHIHPDYNAEIRDHNIALINLNRNVLIPANPNIAPVQLAYGRSFPDNTDFCHFGIDTGRPGESLTCFNVNVDYRYGFLVIESEEGESTWFDFGAPLVKDNVQYGIHGLESNTDNDGVFLRVSDYRNWIERTADINLPRPRP